MIDKKWRKRRVLGFCTAVVITTSIPIVQTDILVYWKAAQRAYNHDTDPYDRQPGDVLPVVYPPTALFMLYPLSQLDIDQSVSAILLAVIVRLRVLTGLDEYNK